MIEQLKKWIKDWLYGDEIYEVPVQTIHYDEVDRLMFKLPLNTSVEECAAFSKALKQSLKHNRAIITTRDITIFHLIKREVQTNDTNNRSKDNTTVRNKQGKTLHNKTNTRKN